MINITQSKKIGLFKWCPVWDTRDIQESFNSKEDAFREYGKCDLLVKNIKRHY